MASIVHLANFHGPRSGGLRTTIEQLGAEYARLGHLMHVIVPGPASSQWQTATGVRHEVRAPVIPGSGGYRIILRLAEIRRILEQAPPDAIELSDRTTLLPIADWARRRGIPVAFIAHERVDGVLRSFAPGLPCERIADHWNRVTASRVDTVIATTGFAAAEFSRIGVGVTMVPLGVDARSFSPDRRSAPWRRQFGPGPLLVLASRLSREKRPQFALEVLRACRRTGLDPHLLVLGDGPLRDAMQRHAVGLPVTFAGFVADRAALARAMASGDVVLAPGPIETFGLAALEALASGTPVIANASSALGEIIDGAAGKVLPLDADAWAGAVAELLADPRARDRARAVAERFSWESTARRMLDVHGLRSDGPRTDRWRSDRARAA